MASAFRLATTSIWISTTGRIRRQRGVRATTGSHPAMFGTRDNARGCCRTDFVANGNGALCAAVTIVPLSARNNPSWRIERTDLSRAFSPNTMIRCTNLLYVAVIGILALRTHFELLRLERVILLLVFETA